MFCFKSGKGKKNTKAEQKEEESKPTRETASPPSTATTVGNKNRSSSRIHPKLLPNGDEITEQQPEQPETGSFVRSSNPSTTQNPTTSNDRPQSEGPKRVTWDNGELKEAMQTYTGDAGTQAELNEDGSKNQDGPPAIMNTQASAPDLFRTKTEKAWHTRGQIRPEVFRQYSTIYLLLSGDQGGEVSAELLASKLRISASQAKAMLNEADEDSNGMLDFDEFVNFMVKKDVNAKVTSPAEEEGDTEQQMKDSRRKSHFDWEPNDGETRRYRMLFELIDRDQNGVLDSSELTAALRTDRFLQKALQGQMNGPPLQTLDFNMFVSALHEYEVTISTEFNNSCVETTPRDSRNHKVRVSANVDEKIREGMKTLLLFLRPEEGSDQINVLRALAFLEATMHASTTQRRKPVSADDYNMHFALQRLLLAKGRSIIPDHEFIDLLRRYPTCQFLTKEQEAEEEANTKAPMMVVSDETGKRMSIDEVESEKALKASQGNSEEDALKDSGAASGETFDVESLDEGRLVMYDTVFDYIDKDGSGTLNKKEVTEAVQEVSLAGADETEMKALHAVLTAIDKLEDQLVYYSDFVEVIEKEGDIQACYRVVSQNLL